MGEKAEKLRERGKATQFKKGSKRASEAGKKGAQAAAQVKREHKAMSVYAKAIAGSEANGRADRKKLRGLGLDDEDMVNQALVVASVFTQAKKGNMLAVEKWDQMTAVSKASSQEYELPASVIGKAFIDLYREICPNMKYVLEGGRGGLKSSFVALEVIKILKNNPDMHACAVRKVAGTLKDSVYAKLIWAINVLHLDDEFECKKSPLEIIYKPTGQILYFRGIDDPIKLKSITPPFGYIGILWVEEADQLAGPAELRSVEQSVLRGGEQSYEFVAYNPPKSDCAWVNKEKLVPDPNRVLHYSTYLDVPPKWLGEKFIKDAEHLKEVNPEAYEHEYLGKANGTGGQVFKYLEIRTITDEEIAEMDHIYQGVDWGWYPDIYAFTRMHIDAARRRIYLIAENTCNETPNVATGQWIIDHGFTDYMITCDSAEKKSINDYKDMGIVAKPCKKYPGSVEYTMKCLQGYTIVIDPARTPMCFKEFTEYEYMRDKEGNVMTGYPDANNHCIDSVRYATQDYFEQRGVM